MDSNGRLDTSFGSSDVAVLLASRSQLASLSNGQNLAFSASSPVAGVTRYNSNGSVDHTFGSLGQATSTNAPATLAVQTNGSILPAGMSITGVAMPTVFTGNPTGFGIMRFLLRGGTDTTFGTEGGVITAFPGMNIGGTATVARRTNGDIVAAGDAGFRPSNQSQFTSSFAVGAIFERRTTSHHIRQRTAGYHSFGSANVAFIAPTAIQNGGKIMVAGETGDDAGDIAVARYLARSLTSKTERCEKSRGCASAFSGRQWFTRPAHSNRSRRMEDTGGAKAPPRVARHR